MTVLYVRNLRTDVTEEELRSKFSLHGTLYVEKVKKMKDFAFIHYKSRDDAVNALNDVLGKQLL